MVFQIQIRIREAQIQIPARCKRIPTRTQGPLPVVKMTTLWLLLGVVATEDLELEKLDVKTTFLRSDLEEEIYMSQPIGFMVTGE